MTAICPISGCGAEIKTGSCMCFTHWMRVPRRLANSLIKAEKNYRAARDMERDHDELVFLHLTCERARAECVQAVQPKVPA